MSQKVLQISAEDAKYIDPNQIASIQMVDGTTIVVNNGEQAQEEFVEEAQNEQQYQTQEGQAQAQEQGQDGQKLRGRGLIGALAGAAAGAALLGTAAAVGGAMRRPYHRGYGYGMRPMMPPPPPPPMMRPHMFGPHFGMRGPGFY